VFYALSDITHQLLKCVVFVLHRRLASFHGTNKSTIQRS